MLKTAKMTKKPKVEVKTDVANTNNSVAKVVPDDLMAIVSFVRVIDVQQEFFSKDWEVVLVDVDNSEKYTVKGKQLVEVMYSADQYAETRQVTKTEMAEILSTSYNTPFTVVFEKASGEERTLRGRLVSSEVLMGRVWVEDLDLPNTESRLRQVDNRTIKSLVVKNIKYVLSLFLSPQRFRMVKSKRKINVIKADGSCEDGCISGIGPQTASL